MQCRAWIRKALNQNCLNYCLETLYAKSTVRLRGNYYEPFAFSRDEEAASVLCRFLKPLDCFPCDLIVDSGDLDVYRPLDPEEALVYAKKVKAELDVSARCPVAAAAGALCSPPRSPFAVCRSTTLTCTACPAGCAPQWDPTPSCPRAWARPRCPAAR